MNWDEWQEAIDQSDELARNVLKCFGDGVKELDQSAAMQQLRASMTRIGDELVRLGEIVAATLRRTITPLVEAVRDAVEAEIKENATPKEWYYIRTARKARVRRKYINRVLRRVERDAKRADRRDGKT